MKVRFSMLLCLMAIAGCGRGAPEMNWVRVDAPGFSGEMGRYPVTNAQYARYMNEALAAGDIVVDGSYVRGAKGDDAGEVYYRLGGPGWTDAGAAIGGRSWISYGKGRFEVQDFFPEGDLGNHPVTYVSWYGAAAFADHYGWRLPTEDEWEAVAGYTDGRIYATGDSLRDGDKFLANYRENDFHPYAKFGTTPVGYFGYFGYGLADMAGNVWEMTASGGPDYRVVRGGSWWYHADNCTVSIRTTTEMHSTNANKGFRVCR